MAPKHTTLTLFFGAALMLSAGQALALNPQPLPPRHIPISQRIQTQYPPNPCAGSGQHYVHGLAHGNTNPPHPCPVQQPGPHHPD